MELLFLTISLAVRTSLAIIPVSIVIGKIEEAIEGPFGWSVTTMTHRLPENHWFSRFYKMMAGKDKVVTYYHMYVNLLWLIIYVTPAAFILNYADLSGNGFSYRAFWAVFIAQLSSWSQFMVLQDFVWFMVSRYYGPKRFNANFIPWHQDYTGKIPSSYWKGMIIPTVATAIVSWSLNKPAVILSWLLTIGFTCFFTFVVLKWWAKGKNRLPLKQNWASDPRTEVICIQRNPYGSVENRPNQLKPIVWGATIAVVEVMEKKHEITPLSEILVPTMP